VAVHRSGVTSITEHGEGEHDEAQSKRARKSMNIKRLRERARGDRAPNYSSLWQQTVTRITESSDS